MTQKKQFVPDYTLGMETKCDMCFGDGQLGSRDDPIRITCSTCGGTGIMPEYLKPGNWEMRAQAAKEAARPSVFWGRNLTRLGRWLQSL